MFETLRKLMYIGLGAAMMSRDKVQQAIDDMVNQGEVSADEGRKLYEDIINRAEEETRGMNDRIKSQIRQYLTEVGVADRSQIEALGRRIDALETRIDQLRATMDTEACCVGAAESEDKNT